MTWVYCVFCEAVINKMQHIQPDVGKGISDLQFISGLIRTDLERQPDQFQYFSMLRIVGHQWNNFNMIGGKKRKDIVFLYSASGCSGNENGVKQMV